MCVCVLFGEGNNGGDDGIRREGGGEGKERRVKLVKFLGLLRFRP